MHTSPTWQSPWVLFKQQIMHCSFFSLYAFAPGSGTSWTHTVFIEPRYRQHVWLVIPQECHWRTPKPLSLAQSQLESADQPAADIPLTACWAGQFMGVSCCTQCQVPKTTTKRLSDLQSTACYSSFKNSMTTLHSTLNISSSSSPTFNCLEVWATR